MRSIPENSAWVKVGDRGIQNHSTGALYFLEPDLDPTGDPSGQWVIFHRGPNTGRRLSLSDGSSIPLHTFHNSVFTAKGSNAEAEARAAFERIAKRLGAVDLLAEEAEGADKWQLEEKLKLLVHRLKAIRAAVEEPLSDLAYQDDDPSDELAIIRVRAADLRALRDALEGAEGVGDVAQTTQSDGAKT